jgi:hypothetical protein
MTLYGFWCFGNDLPKHLEIMTHSESVHLCAELKTGILVMPMDTGNLGTFTDKWSLLLYHVLITVDIIMPW